MWISNLALYSLITILGPVSFQLHISVSLCSLSPEIAPTGPFLKQVRAHRTSAFYHIFTQQSENRLEHGEREAFFQGM